jgi:hypothetical protein
MYMNKYLYLYINMHIHIYTYIQVFDEVDLSCRIETKELYALEGKTALLTDVSGIYV